MTGKMSVVFCLLTALFGRVAVLHAGENRTEQLLQAGLRKAGHELLLRSGDSTSIILPIEKQHDEYALKFTSEFQLDPGDLMQLINSEMKEIAAVQSYLVEVKACGSGKLVYSSRLNSVYGVKQAACNGRILPLGCYIILVTVLETKITVSAMDSPPDHRMKLIGLVIPASFGVGWLVLRKKRRKKPGVKTSELIPIGSFSFDPVQMKLIHPEGQSELTGKEVELLLQLYSSVNQIVDRNVILHAVWGDEGDYVGRTLDVFISRLRKKLEADPAVRILNIRGIGYKLVIG